MRARVPADVDQPDRILFGLTARQIVILSVAGLLLYGMWTALLTVLPPLVLAVVSIPLAGAAVAIATVRRDGTGLDSWLLAAVRFRRSPRRQVPATADQLHPPPAWVATDAPNDKLPLPAPLQLPAKGINPDGTVDLGPDGHTTLVACSTVNFTLRSAAEQNGLIGAFAGFLHSLDGPAQIVVRAHRVDLGGHANQVFDTAAELPDPALEHAATDYATFLADLAHERELLHRQVVLAVRDKRSPTRAAHRGDEAIRTLAGCEVTARPLEATTVDAVLAAACQPTTAHQGGGLW
jgi:hypothetical protein